MQMHTIHRSFQISSIALSFMFSAGFHRTAQTFNLKRKTFLQMVKSGRQKHSTACQFSQFLALYETSGFLLAKDCICQKILTFGTHLIYSSHFTPFRSIGPWRIASSFLCPWPSVPAQSMCSLLTGWCDLAWMVPAVICLPLLQLPCRFYLRACWGGTF